MTSRMLALGGTHFVGRAVAEAGLETGWNVTVFHRGRSASPPGARVVLGDRTAPDGLAPLSEGEWDVVVDTWSAAPAVVRDAAALLAGRAERFVYISSRSVYADPLPAGATEDAAVVEASADDGEVDYARAKAGGELAATAAFGDRALLLRAGLILGSYEDIGRLPWWLNRIAAGGAVLAPGPPDAGIQFVDVRDLAAWLLHAAARGLAGPYDVVSPAGDVIMRDLLESCAEVTGSQARLVWAPPEEILAAGVAPWTELPIWLPPGEDQNAMHGAAASKARAAGLVCRPVSETVRDTWAWLQLSGASRPSARTARRSASTRRWRRVCSPALPGTGTTPHHEDVVISAPPRTRTVARRLGMARDGARFVGRIYADRAAVAYAARVRGDPLSRLGLAGYQADPYPLYDEIRTQGPLGPTRLGNLVSASHAVCSEVVRSRNFAVFNAQQVADDPTPREMLDLSLLELNPPEHTRLRRLAAPAFTPRRMAAYERLIDDRVHRLLDGVDARTGFDLVADFASPLPIAVITELLGVPDVDHAAFASYGATLATALDGVRSVGQLRRLVHAQKELRRIFADLFAQRAADPRDDLVSALLAEQDEQVTAAVLGSLCRLLLVAGFETTVNAIGNGVRALLADPEQWRLLVEDPGRAPEVVEEVLRYDPPVQITARVARQDTELAGVPVRRDQAVVVLLAGANRDPAAYPSPNIFDLTRTAAVDHLAFSGGVHYCLGAPLARLELAAAFRALAERLPTLRLAGPAVMRRSSAIHGAQRLPVAA